VSPGHPLVVPRRHVPTDFDCSEDEKAALWALVERVHDRCNAGAASGQTMFFT
jgi:diadenosine tetraphosphate (Ap4A) HIT family hydrolase